MICSSFEETRIELFRTFTSISVAAFLSFIPNVGLRLIGVFVLSDVSYAPGYFLLLSPAFVVDFSCPIGRRLYENFETPFLHFFDSARKELISYFSSSSSSLFSYLGIVPPPSACSVKFARQTHAPFDQPANQINNKYKPKTP